MYMRVCVLRSVPTYSHIPAVLNFPKTVTTTAWRTRELVKTEHLNSASLDLQRSMQLLNIMRL